MYYVSFVTLLLKIDDNDADVPNICLDDIDFSVEYLEFYDMQTIAKLILEDSVRNKAIGALHYNILITRS